MNQAALGPKQSTPDQAVHYWGSSRFRTSSGHRHRLAPTNVARIVEWSAEALVARRQAKLLASRDLREGWSSPPAMTPSKKLSGASGSGRRTAMLRLQLLDTAQLAKRPGQEGHPRHSDAPTGCGAPTTVDHVHGSAHQASAEQDACVDERMVKTRSTSSQVSLRLRRGRINRNRPAVRTTRTARQPKPVMSP